MVMEFLKEKRVGAVSVFICLFLCAALLSCQAVYAKAPAQTDEYAAATKTWKLYTNDETGIRLKYDPNWQMKLIGNIAFFIISRVQNPYVYIGVYVKPIEDPSQTLREVVDAALEGQNIFEKPEFKELAIGKQQVLMVSGASERYSGTQSAYCFVRRDDDLITMTLTGVPKKEWAKYEGGLRAMISSLEFIPKLKEKEE